MRQKRVRPAGSYAIGSFAERQSQCLGCGVVGPAVCAHCDPAEVKARLAAEGRTLEAAREAAWAICRDCQGGTFLKVTCTNVTCDNFFHRDRTVLDLEDWGKRWRCIK
jgi:hypothetical protein